MPETTAGDFYVCPQCELTVRSDYQHVCIGRLTNLMSPQPDRTAELIEKIDKLIKRFDDYMEAKP